MGERAAQLEEATPEDIAAMRSLATEAMRDGAIGFSTSRTLNHRTASGRPDAFAPASTDELEAIASGVADAGHGVVELISDFWPDTDGEFELVRTMVARTGCPLSLSLAQSHRHPEAGATSRRIEAAVADGLPIRAQVAPRPVGLLVGLQSSYHPLLPPGLRANGGPARRRAGARAARPGVPGPAPGRHGRGRRRTAAAGGAARSTTGASTRWATCPTTSRAPETSVLRLAASRGVDPAALLLDLLAENDGRSFLYTPFSNYADGNLDACGEMLAHPHTVFGLGDGGAHVGLISDASFPTYALSHWARDRSHGRMPVGQVVEQLTSATARAVGCTTGRPGRRACGRTSTSSTSTVWLRAAVMAYDLPAGGKRLLQGAPATAPRSSAGVITYRDGEPTGALPGRLVRGGHATTRARMAEPGTPRGADMNASALHELEPAAEWRADDIADAEAWTLRLERRRPRRARCCADRGQGRRAPIRCSSSATTSRSTAWRPSSTASWTPCSTGGASPASPRSTPARYGDDDLTLLYWGIGLHLGEPWAQNKHGHVLGDVTDQGKTIDDPTVRGNELGGVALDYHTDGSDLVGLLCLRTARSGGLSCVANAVAIHNQLVRERPDLAAASTSRCPTTRGANRPSGARPSIRSRRSPSTPDASSSGSSPSTSSPRNATPTRPGSSATAREAIAAASALANDPDFNVYMDLQPGEMQFINNYHVLHGRTAYEDDVAHGYKRHLKRLWLATHALTERPSTSQHWAGAATGRHGAR